MHLSSNNSQLQMDSEIPLSEIMPLLDPIYSQQFFQSFSELKRRMNEGIFDQQTVHIAQNILVKDPSNYNGWYCKKMHIRQFNFSIKKQQAFAHQCLGEKAKSFQVWEQKRFLTQYHKKYNSELEAVQKVLLNIDHKNYHAWSYRTYLLNFCEKYQEEIMFTTKMIDQDCYNNSAWAYRFYVLESWFQKDSNAKIQQLSQEISFVIQKILAYKGNKASWNYLRGLFPSIKIKNFSTRNSLRKVQIGSYSQFPQIEEFCLNELQSLKILSCSPTDLEGLLTKRQLICTLIHIKSQDENLKDQTFKYCEQLITIDKQKENYWRWVQSNL